MMSPVNNFDDQAIDADSMLSLDDDISMVNMFTGYSSTDASTAQPVTIGITQISPHGTDEDMVCKKEFTYLRISLLSITC
jgi:hypothetical protein